MQTNRFPSVVSRFNKESIEKIGNVYVASGLAGKIDDRLKSATNSIFLQKVC